MQVILVCFLDGTSAMLMRREAKRAGIPGRLAPVPRALQVSCGLAWASPVSEEARVRAVAEGIPHGVIAVLDWDGAL